MIYFLLIHYFLDIAFAASADEWRNRTIYQVLTDRFASSSQQDCDDLSHYCGGTWRDLEDKLDYISTLGFDAIWISPVVENTQGGYHGYWAKNLSALNPNFGSEADLKSLVSAAHRKGIWVMVDVVANHMGGTIASINDFYPFNQASHYHDCTPCAADCNIVDFTTLFSHDCEHCRLSNLPDLDQDNPWVAQQLLTWVGLQ